MIYISEVIQDQGRSFPPDLFALRSSQPSKHKAERITYVRIIQY